MKIEDPWPTRATPYRSVTDDVHAMLAQQVRRLEDSKMGKTTLTPAQYAAFKRAATTHTAREYLEKGKLSERDEAVLQAALATELFTQDTLEVLYLDERFGKKRGPIIVGKVDMLPEAKYYYLNMGGGKPGPRAVSRQDWWDGVKDWLVDYWPAVVCVAVVLLLAVAFVCGLVFNIGWLAWGGGVPLGILLFSVVTAVLTNP